VGKRVQTGLHDKKVDFGRHSKCLKIITSSFFPQPPCPTAFQWNVSFQVLAYKNHPGTLFCAFLPSAKQSISPHSHLRNSVIKVAVLLLAYSPEFLYMMALLTYPEPPQVSK
jgi:hypothetical protein